MNLALFYRDLQMGLQYKVIAMGEANSFSFKTSENNLAQTMAVTSCTKIPNTFTLP